MKTLFAVIFLLISGCLSYGQKGYMHPDTQIDFVKDQINQKHEPYLSAYQLLMDAAGEALSAENHAMEDFSIPGFYQNPEGHRKNKLGLQTDAFNAYASALAYRLGGGDKYGEKACDLLNAWAKTNKKYSDYDGTLAMSYCGTAMIIAAQLMSGATIWKADEQELFKGWTRDVYRKACNEIRHRANNWADWGRFGSLLCAAYLHDADELNENARLIKSDLFKKIAPDGSMPEETRREKNGLWYTYFSLAPITASCWIVYNNTGENLFFLEEDGVSLKTAIDYLAYYNQHPDEWQWYKDPRVGEPGEWPGNLLEAMSGIYNDPAYVQFVLPDRPLMYPTHHFAWTFPTLMPLSLTGYNKTHIQYRRSFQNSKIKFEREKKGRVAFMGGSITEMQGWRDMVCEELQRRFPDTEFDFINAGISSTGTTPGAFRFERDVLCNGPVDLLFEEAAVNDETNHFNDTEQIRGMEGVIRQARLSNPDMDIIMLHFIWDEMLDPLKEGRMPQVILNHEKVAEYYQLPSINLALEVSQRMQAGEFDWDTFGGTHPAPYGHKIYAATISRFFDEVWNSPLKRQDRIRPHVIPGKPLDTFSYFKGTLVDVREAKPGKGWKYEADWQPKVKAHTRKGFVNVPAIETLKPESELRFSFKGKAIGIFHVAGPDAGIIEYSVDGKPFARKDLFTEWSQGLYIPWVTMLETELEGGDHEIVIRTSKERNPLSKGTACQIFYFTVNTD